MSVPVLAGLILIYDQVREQGNASPAIKARQEEMLDELVRRGHIERYEFVAA